MKAINLAKNRQGLVQVLRTVTVKGTTFIRPYWIRPNEVKSNDKVIGGFQNLPKGHSMKPDNIAPNAKVPQEIRDIVTAYQENYLKTRPDKKSADEAFFNDLKANGISWEEHPMPLINMMRAKMAVNISVMAGWKPPGVDKSLLDKAKQYIRQDNTTPQPHTSTSQSTTISLPPKANIASQASKDKTKAFFKSFANDQDFFDALKQMGVSWKENSHPRINGMRAKEALALHIENGFDPVEAFSILNTIPPATDDSDTTVPPVQDIPDDTPPKDESLLEIPDDATPAQVEIIKYVNQMTDLQEIKKCALMGIVPEDNVAKDYIFNTMIRKLCDWIYNGMVTGFNKNGTLSRGKKAPDVVAKHFKEDYMKLGVDMSPYFSNTISQYPLVKDLGTYIDIPEKTKYPILSILNDLLSEYHLSSNFTNLSDKVTINAEYFVFPNSMENNRTMSRYISDLNSAFSDYISDNPDEPSNLGYTGNDLDKCKKQFDLNKEGFVRYLNKLKTTYPTNKELETSIDKSINLYKDIMESLNYNHNLLDIVLKSSSWDNIREPWDFRNYAFGGIVPNVYTANKQLKLIETQSEDVINTLINKGYSDEDIMTALTDFYRNDSDMNSIYISDSQKGIMGKVDIDTSLTNSDHKKWNTYSLMYTLIKFQKMRGIYGTPLGETYMKVYRKPDTFTIRNSNMSDIAPDLRNSLSRGGQDTPEAIVDYVDYLKQVVNLPIDTVIKVKKAGATLFGRAEVVLHQDDQTKVVRDFSSYESQLSDSEHMIISNIIYAAKQHQINEILAKNIRNLDFNDPSDYSKTFKYYSGNIMKVFKDRLTQYGNLTKNKATYTSKELKDQIDKQLDNAVVYSQDYVSNMQEYYYLQRSNQTRLSVLKDTIYANKAGVKAAMNKPSRDIFFNTISNIISNIPGLEKTDKQSLAISLGYEPFDPTNPSKSTLSPKKPKKPKNSTPTVVTPPSEYSPKEIKTARQQLYNRAMGTLATEDTKTNAELVKDFNKRFDYEPGGKTLEGTVVPTPVHQSRDSSGKLEWGSRVAIFNSPFFAIKNTVMWEDRFKAEQKRMKDLGLDEDCWKELDLFHACSRGAVGSIIGRDQGWFMGNEYDAAGKMLGVGAYWGYRAGKSSVYCGDNPYSMEHYGDLAPDSADGAYVLAKVMRGENPKHVKKSSEKWDVKDSKYTSASIDMNVGNLNDWEMAVRNNALILPHHIVDVSCRIVGRNIDQDAQGNFVDDKGNILANKDGVSVGLQQQLENNPI